MKNEKEILIMILQINLRSLYYYFKEKYKRIIYIKYYVVEKGFCSYEKVDC